MTTPDTPAPVDGLVEALRTASARMNPRPTECRRLMNDAAETLTAARQRIADLEATLSRRQDDGR